MNSHIPTETREIVNEDVELQRTKRQSSLTKLLLQWSQKMSKILPFANAFTKMRSLWIKCKLEIYPWALTLVHPVTSPFVLSPSMGQQTGLFPPP